MIWAFAGYEGLSAQLRLCWIEGLNVRFRIDGSVNNSLIFLREKKGVQM